MSSRPIWPPWVGAYVETALDAREEVVRWWSGRASALHWDVTGAGEPVLLITGLGLSGGAWWRSVPVLARQLRVITFDKRGVGRSAGSGPRFTTETMADDAVSVLDAAGLDSAHVYGFSLGGMVAQHVALRHPGRVRSLVLGATHAGGRRAVRPDPEVISFFRRRPSMDAAAAAQASVPFNYGERTRREDQARIAEDLEWRLAHRFPARAYRAQLWAAALHDTHRRLHRIAAPTLVVHGRQDRVVPVGNAEILAAAIPGAELLLLEDSGHLYPTEHPGIDEAIARFLLGGDAAIGAGAAA
jgi:3-oxoadipate enol-lactonase